jgi:4-diphosphocytidyl-2-C-methyl-D-erythritol kinase
VSGRAAAVGAQAKVNLFLHVLAHDATGYHQIDTLFCRLTLADDVVVRLPGAGATSSGARSIDCTGDDAGPADENLAYRAATLYAARRGWPSGFAIEVTKRIPVGGGLGGGSADAGAVLRVLRALDPNPPDPAHLQLWAAQLGADVPLMTLESALALGRGRGDQLLPLPALPSRAVALYVPDFRVSTREAYEWLDGARAGDSNAGDRRAAPAGARELAALSHWTGVVPLMANDFESVVGQRHPQVSTMVSRLRALPDAAAALMSGSGSTVYCVMSGSHPPRESVMGSVAGRFVMTATAEHVVGVRCID